MKRIGLVIIIILLLLCSNGWAGDRVLYLNMDEASGNLTDLSGYGNNCTANGGPDYSQTGAPNRGTAIGFDGSTDWFDCGTGSSLDLTENFTIMSWMYHLGTSLGGILSHDNGGTLATRSWRFDTAVSGNVLGRISDGITGQTTFSHVFTQNVWTHYAFVLSSTQLILYVNGNGLTPVTRTVNPQSQPTWTIKLGKFGSTGYIQALIDDIKVYNYALSAKFIQDEYRQSRMAISRKHEPWKWLDLLKLSLNFRGDQLYEKDNRINYLRQHIVN